MNNLQPLVDAIYNALKEKRTNVTQSDKYGTKNIPKLKSPI